MSAKIVMIEDSATQAQRFAGLLSGHDIEVMVAEDGQQGLRIINATNPDVVVLDINLPGMNGFQICRRLKRDPDTAHIPVIMLTSSDSSTEMVEGLDSGAYDYIPKDQFAPQTLMNALAALGLVELDE